MGSLLYGALLERCARGDDGGCVLELLANRPHEDLVAAAMVLRFLAAVHRLALEGAAPALAARYPSCGGDGDAAGAWVAFRDTVRSNRARIESELDWPVQTNEVGRSAALIGGFLFVTQRYGLPLNILELGASAGLMLRWDRYRYEAGSWCWGPPDSAVQFHDHFQGPLPFERDLPLIIAARRGCDLAPIDATHPAGRRLLLSYLWPDQSDRIDRLTAASDVAQAVPAPVDRCSAVPWLTAQLAVRPPRTMTIVFHSMFSQYMAAADRAALDRLLESAGAGASQSAPLACLSLEPQPGQRPNVGLRLWPGGEVFGLAHASLHGRDVRWALEPQTP